MRILVIILLILAAHFSLTPFAPAPVGQGTFYWPFAADSKSWLALIGGLPRQSGSVVTPLLAGLAGLGFLSAVIGLFGIAVPADVWPLLVAGASAASLLLYILYIGPWAILPMAIDAALLWGVLAQHWSVAALRGL